MSAKVRGQRTEASGSGKSRSQVRESVARAIARHRMLQSAERAVVAVSGGADSVCLLYILNELGHQLVVAHLNHGLRGEAAEADAVFVQELSRRLGHPCVVERRDVRAVQRQQRLSLEEAARKVRHEFLRQVAEQRGAGAIFLGHTADDQVETFLLRLIRGAGVAGLAAMRPTQGMLCRPMLAVWRADVESYLRERGLTWRQDETNLDARFLRNRVRHELIPLLASMNPGIKEVLLREARLLGRRQDRLDAEVLRRLGLQAGQIEKALQGQAVIATGNRRIMVERVRKTATYLPYDVVLPVKGSPPLVGAGDPSNHLEKVLHITPSLAAAGEGGVTVPRGPESKNSSRQASPAAAEEDAFDPAPVTVGTGRTAAGSVEQSSTRAVCVPGVGTISAEIVRSLEPGVWSGGGDPRAGLPEGKGTRSMGHLAHATRSEEIVDAGTVSAPLRVRSRRAGDRFRPLGMIGEKKLQDFLVDEKVPREDRDRLPLVVSGDTIVWVAGLRIDDRFKLTPSTRRFIRLTFQPEGVSR